MCWGMVFHGGGNPNKKSSPVYTIKLMSLTESWGQNQQVYKG